ncbi:hypothetical protein B7P43_G11360 [Cryptotermes secundus]|uniref:Uncharacterized protein n=1 Tax=Cryptotermes secundus TaxID=105785 RepID=A0A2J7QDC9_9NEOP|nr:hypothetical protein B7P43_G11360 [Cryptotermes secundus]
MNHLNLKLQGENNLFCDLFALIKSFRAKLILLESQVKNCNFVHMLYCAELIEFYKFVNSEQFPNLVKDANGDLLADYNILNRWKIYIILNIHRVSNTRQIEIYTAELLVPECSPFEFEIAIEKLKNYKSPGSDQISAELFQAGDQDPLANSARI